MLRRNFRTRVFFRNVRRCFVVNFYTVVFDHPEKSEYSQMLYVMEQSIKRFMPDVNLIVKRVEPAEKSNKTWDNLTKLKHWSEIEDKDPYVLLDCDMFFRGHITTAFEKDFDIGITKRTSGTPPINVGVVFVRP